MYYLEEKEITLLYDGIPKDIFDQYEKTLSEYKESMRSAPNREVFDEMFLNADTLLTAWEDLMELRISKLIGLATIEAITGHPGDTTGILPWERVPYNKVAESIIALRRKLGVYHGKGTESSLRG